MHVAAIQLHPSEDRDETLLRASRLLDEAAALGAKVVLLPELFAVPFVGPVPGDPAYFRLAESLEGPSNTMVAAKSKEHGYTVISSVFEQTETPGVYHNAACTYVAGERVQVYRKSHLPFSNAFPEKYYFRPGDEAPLSIPVEQTRIGTIICYERHFPEMGRAVALQGATLLCVPVASATAYSRAVFELELRGHAVFNAMFVMTANRVGPEGEKDYFGGSAIYGPDGETLAHAEDHGGDELVHAEIDVDLVARKRLERPVLRDRRPELYTS